MRSSGSKDVDIQHSLVRSRCTSTPASDFGLAPGQCLQPEMECALTLMVRIRPSYFS